MEFIEVEKFLSNSEFLDKHGNKSLLGHVARKQGVYIDNTDLYIFRKVLRRLPRINKIIDEIKQDPEAYRLGYKLETVQQKINTKEGNDK